MLLPNFVGITEAISRGRVGEWVVTVRVKPSINPSSLLVTPPSRVLTSSLSAAPDSPVQKSSDRTWLATGLQSMVFNRRILTDSCLHPGSWLPRRPTRLPRSKISPLQRTSTPFLTKILNVSALSRVPSPLHIPKSGTNRPRKCLATSRISLPRSFSTSTTTAIFCGFPRLVTSPPCHSSRDPCEIH